MNKKLIAIIVLAVIIRVFVFQVSEFVGSDTFFHASVVDYYKDNGISSTIYPGDQCSQRTIVQPMGFYLLPTILPFNSKLSIQIAISISTIICFLLFYYYCKKINKNFALMATLFLAVAYINITRSNVWYYRGEHIIMPFLLAAIILIDKPLISATILGLSTQVWEGYPLGIIAYNLILLSLLLINYFKNKKTSLQGLKILGGNLIIYALIYLRIILAPEGIFFERLIFSYYTFLLIGIILTILVFKLTKKLTIRKKIILITILGTVLTLSYLFINPTMLGLVKPGNDFFKYINELSPFHWNLLQNSLMSNVLLLFPIGIFFLFKTDYKKLIYYLGLGLPSIILFFEAIRFRYLASYSIVFFFSYAVYFFGKKIKKKYYYILIGIIFIILASTVFYESGFTSTSILPDHLATIEGIKTKGLTEYCIHTTWDRGSIYEYHGLKSNVDSVAGQDQARIIKYFNFLLSTGNETWLNKSLFIVEQEDWVKVPYMAAVTNNPMNYEIEIIGNVNGPNFKGNLGREYFIQLEPQLMIYLIDKGVTMVPEEIYLQYDENTYVVTPEETGDISLLSGCLVVYNPTAAIFVSRNLCDSNLGKLLLMREKEEYSLVHSTPWIKAYSYIN